ncbi:SAM-dependent methyltransferase [Actinophytocola sediminis]
MSGAPELLSLMHNYLRRLLAAAARYDGTVRHSAELASVVGDYSGFVTDRRHHQAWHALVRAGTDEFTNLVEDLRARSARCAAIMEKYRARQLLLGHAGTTGYFENVESCIEEEFGTFELSPDARVLLVGAGSFPMTPLYIARRTGAGVVGVDIDPEAVELGRQVVARLGSDDLDIRLEHTPVVDLAFTGEASHVIFSSTGAVKYDLLDRIHSSTRDDVVVAVRYGDDLKSLFNYPMREVDRRKWALAENVPRPEQVFDIALYRKV